MGVKSLTGSAPASELEVNLRIPSRLRLREGIKVGRLPSGSGRKSKHPGTLVSSSLALLEIAYSKSCAYSTHRRVLVPNGDVVDPSEVGYCARQAVCESARNANAQCMRVREH